jgi:hypothetical protein
LVARVASMLVLSGSHLGLRILAIENSHEHASITTASILVPPDTGIETYLLAIEMLRMTSRDLNSRDSFLSVFSPANHT